MEIRSEVLDQLAQALYWNLWTLKEINKEVTKWKEIPGVRPFARFYLGWGDPDESLRLSQSALDTLREDHIDYWNQHPDQTIRNMVLKNNHLDGCYK